MHIYPLTLYYADDFIVSQQIIHPTRMGHMNNDDLRAARSPPGPVQKGLKTMMSTKVLPRSVCLMFAGRTADRAPTISPAQDAMSSKHLPRFTMSLYM
jgi:hypothetical protein